MANLWDTWWTTLCTIFVSLQPCSCVIETRFELLLLLFYSDTVKKYATDRWFLKEPCHEETISCRTSLILNESLCRCLFVRLKQHSWWFNQWLNCYGSFPTGEIIRNRSKERQYSVTNLSDTWWTTLCTIFVSLQYCSCMIGTKSELLLLLFYRWHCKEMCYR